MKKTIVSIIVPVFNVEKVLSQCIESVMAQTFSNFELLLIDDGSNDNSGKICDEFAQRDNRISVFHQKNQGVSKARNEGIKHSIGSYLCFIDSDDFVDPKYIERLVENMNYNTLPICGIRFINAKIDFTPESKQVSFEKDSQHIEKVLHNLYFTGPVCKLFSRDVITNNGIAFDASMRLSEDLHFVLRYIQHIDNICLISEALYNYRDPDGSIKYRITSIELSKNLERLNDALSILEKVKSIRLDDFKAWMNNNELSHFLNFLMQIPGYKDFKNEIQELKKIPIQTNSHKLKFFFFIIKSNPLMGYAITKMASII